ncbi:MAG: glutathione S-transferase family protein [Deltaproteobacteria bacterium]|nr:glutathione S-transferase family protein [Deltaproteobacteria bacterium]
MKLFVSAASPFVRKILVQAHECGLADRIEPIDLSGSGLGPTSPVTELSASNPLGKIPALIRDDGSVLYDSRVIAEYLDSLHDGPPLLPTSGPERFETLRRVALADGICDAAVLGRYESVLRPEALRWDEFLDGQLQKIRGAIAALAAETLPDDADLGTIAVAVALGYLDLRWSEHDLWRGADPALVDWHARFAERPSMVATAPKL